MRAGEAYRVSQNVEWHASFLRSVQSPRAPAAAPDRLEELQLPYQLSRDEIDAALAAVREGVRACFRQFVRPPVEVPVSLVVEPSGHVSRVSVDRAVGTDHSLRCVERTVATTAFPRFAGPRMKVAHRFTRQRPRPAP